MTKFFAVFDKARGAAAPGSRRALAHPAVTASSGSRPASAATQTAGLLLYFRRGVGAGVRSGSRADRRFREGTRPSRPWSRARMRAGSASGIGMPPCGASGVVGGSGGPRPPLSSASDPPGEEPSSGYRIARGRSAGPNNSARSSTYHHSAIAPGTNISVSAERISIGSSRNRQIATICGPLGMPSA
jgi:hypothetical protein